MSRNLLTLPIEILLSIFSYLSQEELTQTISPVCSYFYELAHDKSLWRKIRIHDDELEVEPSPRKVKFLPLYSYKMLITNHPAMTHLTLNIRQIEIFSLFDSPMDLPYLKSFQLSCYSHLNLFNVANLVASCPRASEIRLYTLGEFNLMEAFLQLLRLPMLSRLTVRAKTLTTVLDTTPLKEVIKRSSNQLAILWIDIQNGIQPCVKPYIHLLIQKHRDTLTHVLVRAPYTEFGLQACGSQLKAIGVPVPYDNLGDYLLTDYTHTLLLPENCFNSSLNYPNLSALWALVHALPQATIYLKSIYIYKVWFQYHSLIIDRLETLQYTDFRYPFGFKYANIPEVINMHITDEIWESLIEPYRSDGF